MSRDTSLPAICGRVCPQETQCEEKCVRALKGESVGIGRLERFVADWKMAQGEEAVRPPVPNGHRVAVIGSGPSGLACAGDLAKKGYEVTIFEALHAAGGVLVYGIPEFRLPKEIVRREIAGLEKLGVKIDTNVVVGKTISVRELMQEEGFEAVFIGSAQGCPNSCIFPAENLKGVFSANEFLTRTNLMRAYELGCPTPVMKAQRVARDGRRKRGHGCSPLRQASGRQRGVYCIPPQRKRSCRPVRRKSIMPRRKVSFSNCSTIQCGFWATAISM